MDQESKSKQQLEKDLAQALTEGEMAANDPDEAALGRLSPRYVARAQAEKDPIVEETNIVRSVIREIDDRYDDYMQRARANAKGERDEGGDGSIPSDE
ncbi:hypothetical protein [Paenibacillus sp. HJGM_3]|uniref:hypothetical protein n=1 Tax=Paenibacillus sp. HJGM_3 TaxID=3379816 RepID=UPI00385FDFD6